jgi:hypothetical protein
MWGVTNIILIFVLLMDTVLLLMAIWHIGRFRAKLPPELRIILFLLCSDLVWPIAGFSVRSLRICASTSR